MKLGFRGVIRRLCCFGGDEEPKVCGSPVVLYRGVPFTLAGLVWLRSSTVLLVLRMGAFAEVAEPVVSLDAVDVVYLIDWPTPFDIQPS